MELHEQFIINQEGEKQSVILPFKEYQQLIKQVQSQKSVPNNRQNEALAAFIEHNKQRNILVSPDFDLSEMADQINDMEL